MHDPHSPIPSRPAGAARRHRRVPAGLILAGLALAGALGCVPPFLGGGSPVLGGPPSLRVDFSSATAAARLAWQRPPLQGFLRYEVERMDGDEYVLCARIADSADTTWVDEGLIADRPYRYRVSSIFATGDDGEEQRLPSTIVEGGIHRRVNQWPVSADLLPTRIAIAPTGVVHVVGAGSGWIERFDRGGNALRRWIYADSPPACLETAVLDGPALAFDGEGNLHVVHNTRSAGEAPQPQWTKLDGEGRILWTRPVRAVFARHIAIDGQRVFIESISQLQQYDTEGALVEHHTVPPLMVSSVRFWRGAFAALVEPLGYDTAGWQSPRLVVYGSVSRDDVGTVYGRDPLSTTDRGAGLLNRPSDFAPVPAGDRVFVVNAGYDRVEVFRDGRYLTRWGREGSGAGQFRFRGVAEVLSDVSGAEPVRKEVVAGGIARDADGFVYVADTFNHRIQKFAP